MSITNQNLKALWGKSGGICAFPDCYQELLMDDSPEAIGQMCHIVAQQDCGPRGNPDFPKSERDKENNLILLCPTHHVLIDNDTDNYTIDVLTRMKKDHENEIKLACKKGNLLTLPISQLHYINIPRLSILAASQGIRLDLPMLDEEIYLHSLGYRLNALVYQLANTINTMRISAIDFESSQSLCVTGCTIAFSGKFRTKNIPNIDDLRNGFFQMSGNIQTDPIIYRKMNNRRLVISIDPRWLTTTTTFASFTSGWVELKGYAFVRGDDENTTFATPYVLGV